MSDPLLYLKLDLGQSTVFTHKTARCEAPSTLIVGDINNRFTKNTAIALGHLPDNNFIKVQLIEKTTNLVNVSRMTYVLQIFLEREEH
jgi:hypothetical protein